MLLGIHAIRLFRAGSGRPGIAAAAYGLVLIAAWQSRTQHEQRVGLGRSQWNIGGDGGFRSTYRCD